jgi:GT2 family glycosyltransferase
MQLSPHEPLSQILKCEPSILTSGGAVAAVATARAFHALGFPEQTFKTLQAGLVVHPEEPLLWRELLTYFIVEELYFSAQAIKQQLELMGLGRLITAEEHHLLAPFSRAPSVSLYITCFNSVNSVGAVLSAALTQSLGASQIIAIDDGSTDQTSAVISQFPRVQLQRHAQPQGIAVARKTALSAISGDVTAYLDATTVASKFWLERLLVAMIRHPIVGAFGPTIERHTEALPNAWRSRIMPRQRPERDDVSDTIPLGSNALFMTEALRRAAVQQNHHLDLLDEREIGKRLRDSGFQIRYVAKAVCEHMRNDSMQSALSHRFADCFPVIRAAGAYSSEEMLVVRWQTLLRDSLREMEQLNASGSFQLLFPTFLGIFWTTVRDLRELLYERDTPERRVWCSDVLAELRMVINDRVGTYHDLFDAIMLHLQPVLETLPDELLSSGWYRDPTIPLTTMYTSKFRLVLDFPRHVLEALENGARKSLESGEQLCGAPHRVAVLDLAYLLRWRNKNPLTTAVPIDSELTKELARCRIDVAVFDSSKYFISEAQLALALREYAPVEIIFNATGVQDSNVLFALLLLGEWWDDLPAITVCNAPAGLQLEKNIVISRETPAETLRAMMVCQ